MSTDDYNAPISGQTILVQPVPAEKTLFIILLIASLIEWALLACTIIGAIYALLIGLIIYCLHIGFIYHIRSSAIKLGPNQMPELYERVVMHCHRLGLRQQPDAYLRQSDGVLNAFATRFGRSRFIVLNSSLVEACADNPVALDFIIGHEIGHLSRNHLRWRLVLAPAMVIMFLGSAYSRACELTCDRYGFAAAGKSEQSIFGLLTLAAGAKYANTVNLTEFVRQKRDTKGFFMQLAQWLSTYPSLAERCSVLKRML